MSRTLTPSTGSGVLNYGWYDVSSPLETVWRLSKRWEGSKLVVLDGGGDSQINAIVGALNRLGNAS